MQQDSLSSQLRKRPRTSNTVPFGWKLNPNDPSELVEDEAEQETLEYLHRIKDNFSLRKLAGVIAAKHNGRKISPNGIKKILNREYV